MTRNRPRVTVQQLKHGDGLPLPTYETAGSAGMDLRAAIAEQAVLRPLQRMLVPTGLAFAIPEGFEGQVRARSGLAVRHGIGVVNGPGTIDSDYRGEVCVILVNLGEEPFAFSRGDRIAQLVIAPVVQAQLVQAGSLDESSRGAGGFGHTGLD
jgi:dUTP pyrophosphatase